MGYGDEIMGSGMARGAAARGKRIAFGDGRTIKWHANAHQIFRNNRNVAPPGCERDTDLEWIEHYPGRRQYCRIQKRSPRRWSFTPGTQRVGELFFDDYEILSVQSLKPGFVLIESGTKPQAVNKQWSRERYAQVASVLMAGGYNVVQFNSGLRDVRVIHTSSFRLAAAALSRASLYVGPEGGLHHAAAALGIPAVVIFGGFISPDVTGYESHVNLFSGDGLGCGTIDKCEHCRQAMNLITVDHVVHESMQLLRKGLCA